MFISVSKKMLIFVSTILFIGTLCSADPDIIFVGAGPVGLYTAIQTKLYEPKIKIHFIEKYSEYQRKHSVFIDQNSFNNSHQDLNFREILSGFGNSTPTAALEQEFLNLATQQLKITTEYKEINSVDEIHQQYPATKIIVGSDGSHSKIRKIFESHHLTQPLDLGYLVQVKYEVSGSSRKLNRWTEGFYHLKIPHVLMEHVGKPNTDGNRTQIALNIIASKEEYELLKKQSTFKDPVIWNSEKYHKLDLPHLKKTIDTWLGKRGEILQENRDESSIKVTCTNLPEYYAPQVYYSKDDHHYFLVGDAAFGVPYFRSINNGFESGNVLARVLAKLINPKHQFTKTKHPIFSSASSSSYVSSGLSIGNISQETPEDYEKFIKELQKRENLVAHAKSLAAKCWVKMHEISHASHESSHSQLSSDESSSSCTIF